MILKSQRKVRGPRTPLWALDTKALNKWKNTYGVMLLVKQEAQVIFRDFGDPIAVMLLRPLNIRKDGKRIIGTFLLEKPEENYREWVMGFYYGSLGAFVVNAAPEHMFFVIKNPKLANYLDVQARERIAAAINKEEREKCRTPQKLEGESVLYSQSGWEYISSPREALAEAI